MNGTSRGRRKVCLGLRGQTKKRQKKRKVFSSEKVGEGKEKKGFGNLAAESGGEEAPASEATREQTSKDEGGFGEAEAEVRCRWDRTRPLWVFALAL